MDPTNRTLYSFDIFDTLLARRVCPADAAYRFLQASLPLDEESRPLSKGNDPAMDFSAMRHHAGRVAHERHHWATNLHDIYRELCFTLDQDIDLDGDLTVVRRFARAEVEFETRLLYPIPEGVQQLQSIRAQGHDVVFVSDMHMQEDYLVSILEGFGLWQEGDRLFVSCDYGVTKGEGLFETLIRRGELPGANVVHVGNSIGSDVKPARKAGLRAIHIDAGNPNRYETTLGEHAQATRGLSALLAGASRHARLHRACASPRDAHLRDVAAGVAAPVLTSFVIWTLLRASRHGIKRLYFTSRRGQVLFHIARRLLAKGIGVDCDVRYLHVCKDALDRAGRGVVLNEQTPPQPVAVADEAVLARVGSGAANTEGVVSALQAIRLQKTRSEHRRPSHDERRRESRHPAPLSRPLPAGRDRAEHRPEMAHKIVLDYLSQEGLGDDVPVGIVDLGWTGSTHAVLNQILMDSGMRDTPVWGSFFGLTTSTPSYRNHRASYFFDAEQSLGYTSQALDKRTHGLIEAFCAADHGAVQAYAYRADQVVPVMDDTWSPRMEAWGLEVVRDTIDHFLDGLMYDEDFATMGKCLRAPLTRVIRQFWDAPITAEADAWGTFPCKLDSDDETRIEPLAAPYAASDVLTFATSGPEAHATLRHPRTWPEGSMMTSPAWTRRAIRFVLRLGRGFKRVQRKLGTD